MILTIVLMILFDVVHPPAVSTSLSFALCAGDERDGIFFGLAGGITPLLVVMERVASWIPARFNREEGNGGEA